MFDELFPSKEKLRLPLLICTNCVSFLAFALLYTLVYRITSHTCYSIVSGAGRER